MRKTIPLRLLPPPVPVLVVHTNNCPALDIAEKEHGHQLRALLADTITIKVQTPLHLAKKERTEQILMMRRRGTKKIHVTIFISFLSEAAEYFFRKRRPHAKNIMHR